MPRIFTEMTRASFIGRRRPFQLELERESATLETVRLGGGAIMWILAIDRILAFYFLLDKLTTGTKPPWLMPGRII